ncbi:MAG: ABC transporter permease, partial [Bacteroidales bacterium]
MMGKIIGIALVGFLQLAIWGSMLAIILTVVSVSFGAPVVTDAAAGGGMMGQDVTGSAAAIAAASEGDGLVAALLFVLYFIGGYLLYASFFAAVGASVNEQEDSSQFIMPVMLIMVFALYAAMGSAQNTDGPLAFWASLFPLTAPIVMMVRIPFGVPLWQELLSVGLLYATALGFVWFSAKIYRVGILMYGKKPTIKEMIKWVRYK